MNRSFTKSEHLLTTAQFQRVYDRRRSASDESIIIYACENHTEVSRLGLSVSKKYGGAVQRNRIKRLYREAYRLCKTELPTGLDLIFIPRSKTEPPLEELKKSLCRLIKQVSKKMQRDSKPNPSGDTSGESSASPVG